jgi:hypothetical protein
MRDVSPYHDSQQQKANGPSISTPSPASNGMRNDVGQLTLTNRANTKTHGLISRKTLRPQSCSPQKWVHTQTSTHAGGNDHLGLVDVCVRVPP